MTQRDENQTHPMTEFERKWIAEHPEFFAAMKPITPGMFKGKPNFEPMTTDSVPAHNEPYTPKTGDVRDAYAGETHTLARGYEAGYAEFDRWLSSLLSTARADGLGTQYVDDLLSRADGWMAEDENDPGYVEAQPRVVGLVGELSNVIRRARTVVPLTTEEKK